MSRTGKPLERVKRMIKLELWDKNWSAIGEQPFSVEADYVPRVGEIVDVAGLLNDLGDPTTFIVVDALWEFADGKIVPRLKCHRWLEGDRQLELEEHGWVHGYTRQCQRALS